jgi:thymidylate synthase ThyX
MKEKYRIDRLPFDEDLHKYAPDYTPEIFSEEEKNYLRPFFSNLDKPVFVTHSLPEEVNAALDSRYSRSTYSKRRLFLKEYVAPIVRPEETEAWKTGSASERREMLETKAKFQNIVDFLNNEGGLTYVVNIQRARKFFDVWLSAYGDDSIAEMGSGFHVSMEGVSSLVLEEVVSKRVGISPLVKSTRYVRFDQRKPDGEYMFSVPGELKGGPLEKEYKDTMNLLFETYTKISEPYLEYIKGLYPRGEDETEASFLGSRRAKRFDDIRDLLPFSTENNMGLSGNGRAFEDLINRLLASEIGEARWWAKEMTKELTGVAPSFVARPQTRRGAELQQYRSNLNDLRKELIQQLSPMIAESPSARWSKLISSTPDAEVEIISTFLATSDSRKSLGETRAAVLKMNEFDRIYILSKILDERKFGKVNAERTGDRFKKVPRAFENAHYLFEIWGRGGDMRDIHRHRQATEGHPPYTTHWGYDLENELKNSPFLPFVENALRKAALLYEKTEKRYGSEIAQYTVPFGYLQRWYMNLSAREIFWIAELRTGPQARPHYKEIVLSMVDAARQANPNIFSNVLVDRQDYRLSRRESEKKLEKKKK